MSLSHNHPASPGPLFNRTIALCVVLNWLSGCPRPAKYANCPGYCLAPSAPQPDRRTCVSRIVNPAVRFHTTNLPLFPQLLQKVSQIFISPMWWGQCYLWQFCIDCHSSVVFYCHTNRLKVQDRRIQLLNKSVAMMHMQNINWKLWNFVTFNFHAKISSSKNRGNNELFLWRVVLPALHSWQALSSDLLCTVKSGWAERKWQKWAGRGVARERVESEAMCASMEMCFKALANTFLYTGNDCSVSSWQGQPWN